MLAQQSLHGEDTTAAIPARPGRPAHLRKRPGAVVDALTDGPVTDDLTVADDHTGKATLTTPP
jgi:hypothetical protein